MPWFNPKRPKQSAIAQKAGRRRAACNRPGGAAAAVAVAVSPLLASAAAPALGAVLLTLGGPVVVYASCLAMAVAGLSIAAVLLRPGRAE